MPLLKLVRSTAYAVLSKLLDLGIAPPAEPITFVARDEASGVQVLVTVAAYSPPQMYVDNNMNLVFGDLPKPTSGHETGRETGPKLTKKEKAIVDLLSKTKPRKLEWLWEKAGNPAPGKAISGSFRERCQKLCSLGVAKHIAREGYLLL